MQSLHAEGQAVTALWRGPADRFELARWVDGPHRGMRVERPSRIGGLRIILRRQLVRREHLTGRNEIVWKSPIDEIWRTFGRAELQAMGKAWRTCVAREIRHCRHLLREARKA